MNVLVMGATGFIGRNLIEKIYFEKNIKITAFSRHSKELEKEFPNLECINGNYCNEINFKDLIAGKDIIYHLISTTVPSTSNKNIEKELSDNVIITTRFLETCCHNKVKKVVFISSGGTVYGKDVCCPIKEDAVTNPINSYGIQKLTIEKLIYLYHHMYGIDYRIIRLSNPYGPHQRINSGLGVIANFIHKAINEEAITIFGDGSVVRDFIYIDDAIEGIVKLTKYEGEEKLFNLGSGIGKSISDVVDTIQKITKKPLKVKYQKGRSVDVAVNILDISRYKNCINPSRGISFYDGIKNTIAFQCSGQAKL